MSLLSRKELSIVLCPERIALLHSERKLTQRGYERFVHSRQVIPCETADGGGMPWSSALKSLETAVSPLVEIKMDVNVVLSNHFAQYALIPWFDDITDEEEIAVAVHCFSEMSGTPADTLSIRINPGMAGAASLASAVDTRLLDELDGLLAQMKSGITSIQPHLMVAYNCCSEVLSGRSAWVVLLESGSLCLAVLQKGQLVWIRKMRIGADWHAELPAILEREACLANTDDSVDDVLLWGANIDAMDTHKGRRWNVQQMMPGMKPGSRMGHVGKFILEMGL